MTNSERHEQSKKNRNFVVGLLGVLVFFYGGCLILMYQSDFGSGPVAVAPFKPPKPILPPDWKPNDGLTYNQDAKWKTNEYGNVFVAGTVKNESTKTFRYVQISFNILDKSGAQVGNAFANVTGLEPGTTWKFQAMAYNVSVGSYFSFHEVKGW